MNEFKVTTVIDGNHIKVDPYWEMDLKGVKIQGNRIFIRGLEGLESNDIVKNRLEKILLNTSEEITFDAPELIDTSSHIDSIASCSVYLARTNIAYYFPEYVKKS